MATQRKTTAKKAKKATRKPAGRKAATVKAAGAKRKTDIISRYDINFHFVFCK